QFQDGAWYRYLVDFTVMSPLIVALVFARAGNIDKQTRADFFWTLFLVFSFAAYWDEPLRWLAASQIAIISNRFAPRWRNFAIIVAVVMLAIVDLAQYDRFFIKAGIYDPVSTPLLRASKLVK